MRSLEQARAAAVAARAAARYAALYPDRPAQALRPDVPVPARDLAVARPIPASAARAPSAGSEEPAKTVLRLAAYFAARQRVFDAGAALDLSDGSAATDTPVLTIARVAHVAFAGAAPSGYGLARCVVEAAAFWNAAGSVTLWDFAVGAAELPVGAAYVSVPVARRTFSDQGPEHALELLVRRPAPKSLELAVRLCRVRAGFATAPHFSVAVTAEPLLPATGSPSAELLPDADLSRPDSGAEPLPALGLPSLAAADQVAVSAAHGELGR